MAKKIIIIIFLILLAFLGLVLVRVLRKGAVPEPIYSQTPFNVGLKIYDFEYIDEDGKSHLKII